MKEGWTYKKIKEVGEVIGGTTPSTSNPAFWDRFFEVGGYKDFQDFEKSIELKSSPVTANQIELKVYVYEDGHTLSTLTGCGSGEISVS